jgi:hypothetical protein
MTVPKTTSVLNPCLLAVRRMNLDRFRVGDSRKWKVLARNLSALLEFLASFANDDGTFMRNGINYSPGQERMMKKFSFSDTWVEALLKFLRDLGYLSWTRENKHDRCLYTINMEAVSDANYSGDSDPNYSEKKPVVTPTIQSPDANYSEKKAVLTPTIDGEYLAYPSLPSSLNPPSNSAVVAASSGDGKAGVDAEKSTATSLVDAGNGKDAGNKNLVLADQNQTQMEERAELLISAAHQKQISKAMTNDESFREYDFVWKQLQREYEAWSDAPWSERERLNLPEGANWGGDLRTNKKHRHDAAELYRDDPVAALANWKAFLVNTNPEIKAGEPILDDDNRSTGKFASTTEQIAWPLREFVLRHGISVMETKS